jgi:hypothetical protein
MAEDTASTPRSLDLESLRSVLLETGHFNVREDAPLIIDKVGDRFRIVPVSLMRRRTLVNMRITDEAGHVLPTPGIRLTQQLDESILLAVTVSVAPELAAQEDVRALLASFEDV